MLARPRVVWVMVPAAVVDPVLGGPEFGSAGPTDRFADALTVWRAVQGAGA